METRHVPEPFGGPQPPQPHTLLFPAARLSDRGPPRQGRPRRRLRRPGPARSLTRTAAHPDRQQPGNRERPGPRGTPAGQPGMPRNRPGTRTKPQTLRYGPAPSGMTWVCTWDDERSRVETPRVGGLIGAAAEGYRASSSSVRRRWRFPKIATMQAGRSAPGIVISKIQPSGAAAAKTTPLSRTPPEAPT